MRFRQTRKYAAVWMMLTAFTLTGCLVSAEEIPATPDELPVQEEQTEILPDEEVSRPRYN